MTGEANVGSIVATLRIDGAEWAAALAEAQRQAEALGRVNPNVRITTNGAELAAQLGALRSELDALKAENVVIKLDLAQARAEIARLTEEYRRRGTEAGGAFATGVQKAVRESLAAIPKVDVDANTTPAQAKLQEIRAKMAELGEQKIGVDITAADALAKLKVLQAELDKLNRNARDDIRVRVDTAEASAKIAALRAELGDLKKVSSSSSGGGSGGMIFGAIVAGASLAGPLVAAGTAGLVEFAGAAGVAALAVKGLQTQVKDETAVGMNLRAQFGTLRSELVQFETIAGNQASNGVLGALVKIKGFLPELNGPIAGLAEHLGGALNIGATGTISALRVMSPLLQDAGVDAENLAQRFANFTASDEFQQFISYARQELPTVGHDLADIGSALVQVGIALQPVGDELLTVADNAAKGVTHLSQMYDMLEKIQGGTSGKGSGSNGLASTFNKLTSYFPALNPVGYASRLNGMINGAPAPTASTNLLTAGAASSNDHEAALAAASAAQAQQSALAGVSRQYGLSVPAFQAASAAQKQDTDARLAAIDVMKRESDAGGLLKDALDQLNGKQLTAAQAQNQFEQSLLSNAQTIQSAKQAHDGLATSLGLTKKGFTGVEQAQIANRSSLLSEVQAAGSAAEAYGSMDKSGVKTRQRLIDLRDQIIKNAVATGQDKDEVTKYVDSVLKIPPVATTHVDVENAAAAKKLAAYKAALALLPKSIQQTVKVLGLTTAEYELQLLARDRTSTIKVTTVGGQGTAGTRSVSGVQVGEKTGKRATGGDVTGPGTGTSDSVAAVNTTSGQPYKLSTGEEIQTAASNRLNHAALQAANHGARLAIASSSATGRATGGNVGDGVVTLAPSSSGSSSSSSGGSSGSKSKNVPTEFNGIMYSSATAADNARVRFERSQAAKAKTAREKAAKARAKDAATPETETVTAGGGRVVGVATYLKGQVGKSKAAMKLLTKAVNDEFQLTGAQSKLKKFQDDLADVRQQAASLQSGVTNSLTGKVDVSQYGSATDMIAALQNRTGVNQHVTNEETVLSRKGVNKDLLAQLVANGDSAGLASLAGASKATISQANKAFTAFQGSAKGAGAVAAHDVFGSRIQADASGVKAQTANVDRLSKDIDSLVGTIARSTGQPISIELDGKVLYKAVFKSKEFQGVMDQFGRLVKAGGHK